MHSIEDFKRLGLYIEKPTAEECEFDGGKVVRNPEVSERIKEMLRIPGGDSHEGDFSRQDSAVITSLLAAGYSPPDVYITFLESPRGHHAEERKLGHVEDYIKRTIEKALGFLKKNSKISVDFGKKRQDGQGSGIMVSMGNEIETEKVRWIWPQYIPLGKLTILAGDPGMGKSTIALDIISRISRGTFLPSGNRSVTGTSLVASAEDSPEDTIVPRLIACGANLKKIGIIGEVRDVVDEGDTRFLSLPRDLKLLKELLIARGARILIIDPLNAFLEKGTDTYKDQDMRRVLHPLEAIAQESGTSILVVAHLTKKEETSTLYRVGGSIGFIGAARSVLGVTRTEDEERVLYGLKSNLSARPASLSYETKQVRKQRTNGEWLGEKVIHSSSIRWLGEVDFNPFAKKKHTPEGKVSEEACEFLQQILQDAGEMETDLLYQECKQAGISRTSINKAKVIVGIKTTKKGSRWYWQWPEN